MSSKPIYGREYRIYKPNKNGDGAATKFQIKRTLDDKYDPVKVFIVSAKQEGADEKGNAKLAWTDREKSVTMLLGEPDIGDLLAVLNGEKPEVGAGEKSTGIFHKNQRGTTTLQFKKMSNGYGLRLASKNGDKLIEVKHMISVPEAQILKVLLERAIQTMYSWSL